MPTVKHNGNSFEVDEDGHLWNVDDYGPEWVAYCLRVNSILPLEQKIVACLNKDGSLTDEHHRVMDILREYYKKNQIIPLARILSKSCKIPLPRIQKLFPAGTDAGAGKIAGVPSTRTQNQHW